MEIAKHQGLVVRGTHSDLTVRDAPHGEAFRLGIKPDAMPVVGLCHAKIDASVSMDGSACTWMTSGFMLQVTQSSSVFAAA